jgi:hypothetical protein
MQQIKNVAFLMQLFPRCKHGSNSMSIEAMVSSLTFTDSSKHARGLDDKALYKSSEQIVFNTNQVKI